MVQRRRSGRLPDSEIPLPERPRRPFTGWEWEPCASFKRIHLLVMRRVPEVIAGGQSGDNVLRLRNNNLLQS